MIKVAPSILAADQLKLGAEVQRMVDAGCDLLHVDVMDAHFVPNLSFSPAVVSALHGAFPALKLDVHLMMDNPETYLEKFVQAGAWNVTIHAEIGGDVAGMLKTIRGMGVSAGLSVKPQTPAEAVADLLPLTDMLLVMTVEPGFGGQAFQEGMLDKIRVLRRMGYAGLVEADGGVRLSNLPQLLSSGLDVAVLGTALFRSADPKADIAAIHALRRA